MGDEREAIFTVEATPIKFGAGAVDDAGWEAGRLGITRALLVTDPGVVAAGHADRVRARLEGAGVMVVLWDRTRVEPSIDSVREAAEFAREARVDGFVSVGGGSSIDTAKVANLVVCDRADVMEYVNAPIGAGRKPAGPLMAHLAIPTTGGSGSEATTVAVVDLPELRVKSGISHCCLRPAQAIVDPDVLRTLPREIVAATGLDVVCHAAESFLARPFDSRPWPASPGDRPPYQGANPVADVWSAEALRRGGRFLRRAVADPADLEARGAMMLAATMAGVGFGSAGVHVSHACSYPIAGLLHEYVPPGYPADHPFVPHGQSVVVTAPAAFRFTYAADPERHHRAAELLTGGPLASPGPESLPDALRALMRDVGAPCGLAALGYGEEDVQALVDGALRQQRLLLLAPREPDADDLALILRDSMANW